MAIKREELMQKRQEVINRIENLERENKNARYVCNRYLEGYGLIEGMDKDTLLGAHVEIKGMFGTRDSALEELGFDTKRENDETYLGFTMDEWLKDLKTRAQVIRNEEKICDLEEAIAIIDNNLSEDDRFALEMESLASLL